MNSQKAMVIIIVVALLSVVVTAVIVNGCYSAGGVEEYIHGILSAIVGRQPIQ